MRSIRAQAPFILLAMIAMEGLCGNYAGAATISITVFASSAPNADLSPSFAGWSSNVISALENNPPLTTNGGSQAIDPTAYNTVTNMSVVQFIVSSFNSWNGVLDPGGNFVNEFGNRLQFPVVITDSDGFTLSQVSYVMTAPDPFGLSGSFTSPVGNLSQFSNSVVGKLADGSYTTAMTSPSQSIVALYTVGVGNAEDADGEMDISPQADLSDAISDLNGIAPFSITTTYSLDGFHGTATVDISPTPEPGTLTLLGIAIASMAACGRRRRQKLQLVGNGAVSFAP